jgi:hypothetical protein
MALKTVGAGTADSVAEVLTNSQPSIWRPATESKVAEILDRLTSIRANDGSLESLAVRAADGLWSANGV